MSANTERRINGVYRAMNKPLTILGAERRLFFCALVLGAATFNLFNSLFAGILLFAVLLVLAQWATRTDPQILRILLNAGKFRKEYDPCKYVVVDVRRIDRRA